MPASYQGLWGLRTTHGLVPRQGLLPLAQSFDTVGWLTRDGATLQRVADWCLSYDGSESTESVYGESGDDLPWRFLVPEEVLAAVEPETRGAFEALLVRLAASDDRRPFARVRLGDLDDYFEPFRTVQAAEAWRNNGAWVREHPDAVGPAVAERFRLAAGRDGRGGGVRSRAPLEPPARASARTRGERRAAPADRARGPRPCARTSGERVDAVRAGDPAHDHARRRRAACPRCSVPLLTVPSLLGPGTRRASASCRVAGTDIALVRLARDSPASSPSRPFRSLDMTHASRARSTRRRGC